MPSTSPAIPTADGPPSTGRDRGSAAVDFVLVGTLLTLLFLALVQLGVDLYVRSVLSACASEGARYAANADLGTGSAAQQHTDDLIADSLGKRYANATADVGSTMIDGQPVVTVEVNAHLPLIAWFLPQGPTVHVTGHALVEQAP